MQSILLIEGDESRAIALKLAAERMGAKLYDYAQVDNLDYFIHDLSPSLIMINAEQFQDELVVIFGLVSTQDIAVMLYGPEEKLPASIIEQWGATLKISYEKFPLRPLELFKRIIENG